MITEHPVAAALLFVAIGFILGFFAAAVMRAAKKDQRRDIDWMNGPGL